MGLERFLRALSAYRWPIVVLCISAMLNAAVLTYALSEMYEATALVLVRPGQELRLGGGMESSKSVLSFPVGMNPPSEAPSKTFTELITSREVLERVAENLGLNRQVREPAASFWKELWERAKDEASDLLGRTWEILQYGRTLPPNPLERAIKELRRRIVVTSTKNSYVFAISCRWKSPVMAQRIVDEAAKVFVEVLADAAQREAAGGREFVEQRLLATERELAEAREALRRFKEENKSISFAEETSGRIKLIGDLESSYEATEAELSGLTRQYSAINPKVQKAQGELESLKRSIDDLETEQGALPAKEAQLAALRLRVRVDETIYELVRKEHEEARIREAKRTSEISIVSPPALPIAPVKPIRVYYAATALVLAIVVGIGLVALLELTDDTLRDVDGVEAALGVPVLGCIPRVGER